MLQCVSCRFACFYEDRLWNTSVVENAAVCQLHAHPWGSNIWAAAAAICKAERFRLLHCIDCLAQSEFSAVRYSLSIHSADSEWRAYEACIPGCIHRYYPEASADLEPLTCMDCGARSDCAFGCSVSDFTHDGVFRCRQCEVSYFPEAAQGDEQPLICMDCGVRSDFATDSLVSNFTHDGVLRCKQCELWYFPEAAHAPKSLDDNVGELPTNVRAAGWAAGWAAGCNDTARVRVDSIAGCFGRTLR